MERIRDANTKNRNPRVRRHEIHTVSEVRGWTVLKRYANIAIMSPTLALSTPREAPPSIASYPIRLPLRYELSGARTGQGRTIQITRKHVLLEGAKFPSESPITLSIEWPAKLENKLDLMLHVRGETVGTVGGHTAVQILRWEFRIRPRTAV